MRQCMAVSIGRLCACPILHSTRVALRYNTIRGAVGGSLLNAELGVKKDVYSIESACGLKSD
jgi:aspartate-semialdehyde dehydrogenase